MLLFPLYWMVVTAVLPTSQRAVARARRCCRALADIEFRAFAVVFARKPLATWLDEQPARRCVGATAISLVIAALAGYSLSRFRTRGAGADRARRCC